MMEKFLGHRKEGDSTAFLSEIPALGSTSFEQFVEQFAGCFDSDPEIEEMLNEINFDVIRDLLSRDLRVSTGRRAVAHIVPRERIVLLNKEGARRKGMSQCALCFDPDDYICINVEQLRGESNDKDYMYGEIVSGLIHEQGHASNALGLHTVRDGDEDRLYLINGVQQLPVEHEGEVLWEALDEGINNKRELELTRKYLTICPPFGMTNQHVERVSERFRVLHDVTKNMVHINAYLIDALVSKIARSVNKSEVSVWRHFVCAVQRGAFLEEASFRDIIVDALGQRCYERLRRLPRDITEILRFIIEFDLVDDTRQLITYAEESCDIDLSIHQHMDSDGFKRVTISSRQKQSR